MALHLHGPLHIPERLASHRYLAELAPPPDMSRSTTLPRSPRKASWFDPCRDRVLPLPLEQSRKHETFDDFRRLAHRRKQDVPIQATSFFPERPDSPELPRKDSVHSHQSLPGTTKLNPLVVPRAPTTPVLPAIDRSPYSRTLKRPASDLGLDHGYEQHERPRRQWSAGEISPKTTHGHSQTPHRHQLPLTPPADHLCFPRMSIPQLLEPRVSERLPQTFQRSQSTTLPSRPYIDRPHQPQAHHASLSPSDQPSIPEAIPGSTVLPSHTGHRVKYKGICHTPQGDYYTYEDGSLVPTHVDGEPVNPAWGLTKANRPRKRLPKACRACRDEKSRCEPTRSGCMRCDVTGRTCQS